MTINNKEIVHYLRCYVNSLELEKVNRKEYFTTYADKKITKIKEQIKELTCVKLK